MSVLSDVRAAALADRLELDVMTVGVCLLCLSFAAFPTMCGSGGYITLAN